jgi:hypothetical protein
VPGALFGRRLSQYTLRLVRTKSSNGAARLALPETQSPLLTTAQDMRLKPNLNNAQDGVPMSSKTKRARIFIEQSSSQPMGLLGLSRAGRMPRMATAVSGSAKRAAPGQFRDRVKTGGVLGQSPLPKTTAPSRHHSLHRASCRANRNARGVNPVRA